MRSFDLFLFPLTTSLLFPSQHTLNLNHITATCVPNAVFAMLISSITVHCKMFCCSKILKMHGCDFVFCCPTVGAFQSDWQMVQAEAAEAEIASSSFFWLFHSQDPTFPTMQHDCFFSWAPLGMTNVWILNLNFVWHKVLWYCFFFSFFQKMCHPS